MAPSEESTLNGLFEVSESWKGQTKKKLAQTKRDKHWALLSKNLCYNLCSGFPKSKYKFLCFLEKDKEQKQTQATRNRSHVEVRRDVGWWKLI